MTNPDDINDPENLRELRRRQRGRSLVLGLILGGLCILFYLITIVKMGVHA